MLLDEPTTADLRAKVAQAWQDFAQALAEGLQTLPAAARIDLTLDPTASGTGDTVYSISIGADDAGQLLALAVGNATLPDDYRLDRTAVAEMIALGWSPPGVIDGSNGNFGLRTTTDRATSLATVVSRTLRDIYRVPHPAFLLFQVSGTARQPLPVVSFGSARPLTVSDETISDLDDALAAVAQPGHDALTLEEQVRAVIAAMMHAAPEQLQVDADGDISIRAGSAMVFVRVRDTPPLVDVFSPVLTDVEPTERLYVRLSELTNRMPIGRLYCADDTVWASIPVFGRNFQPVHLMLAVQVMTGLADELDDRLHGEFGGRRFFADGDKPVGGSEREHRTGMYL
ncbi:MAG TPA: hypothetical protein VF174_14895 [Micromonosporaceae bacterium]